MKGSNRNMDKAKGTTNNRAIECSLCAPFPISSIFLLFFLFFCPFFLLPFYFFLSKKYTRTNHKKI